MHRFQDPQGKRHNEVLYHCGRYYRFRDCSPLVPRSLLWLCHGRVVPWLQQAWYVLLASIHSFAGSHFLLHLVLYPWSFSYCRCTSPVSTLTHLSLNLSPVSHALSLTWLTASGTCPSFPLHLCNLFGFLVHFNTQPASAPQSILLQCRRWNFNLFLLRNSIHPVNVPMVCLSVPVSTMQSHLTSTR